MTYLPVALGSLLLQYMPTEYPLLPPCMYITALHCNAAPHAWLMLSCCRHTITDGDFTRRWLKRNLYVQPPIGSRAQKLYMVKDGIPTGTNKAPAHPHANPLPRRTMDKQKDPSFSLCPTSYCL